MIFIFLFIAQIIVCANLCTYTLTNSNFTQLVVEQVAQRATIAHLSPMCQGQISFQKTYKWAMETRRPKSNLSELLCLSWLPATLMMIRSKMNELAWRHHFPIITLWEFFRPQGQITPYSVVRSGRNSNLSEILCMSSLPASIKRIG